MTIESTSLADDRRETFVLQEIQAGLTGRPLSAALVGLAASLGAASMGLSEALSAILLRGEWR